MINPTIPQRYKNKSDQNFSKGLQKNSILSIFSCFHDNLSKMETEQPAEYSTALLASISHDLPRWLLEHAYLSLKLHTSCFYYRQRWQKA